MYFQVYRLFVVSVASKILITFSRVFLILFSIFSGVAHGSGFDQYPVINRDHFTLYPEIAPSSRTELRTCEQSERGLQAAIIKAYFNHIAMENYASSGRFEVGSGDLREIKGQETEDHASTIRKYVTNLDSTGRTAVLVYDYEISPGHLSFCSWMITPDELIMPNQKAMMSSDRPLSIRQREALAVSAVSRSNVREIIQNCQPENNPNSTTQAIDDCVKSAIENDIWLKSSGDSNRNTILEISQALLPMRFRAKLIDRSINRLVVLPAVDVGNVSFSSLPLSKEAYLVDYASVIVTNDFYSLIGEERRRAKSKFADSGALVVINPTGDLTYAEDEGEAHIDALTRKSIAVTALTGQEATRWSTVDALFGKRIFFFTGHGQSSPAQWGENYLRLYGGAVLADKDIFKMVKEHGPFLNSALVVLSACQTGLGAVMGGTVLGLPTAWSVAGADQTVMSLWDVNDRATYLLMSRFSSDYLDGNINNAEDALRQVIRDYRMNTGGKAAPAFWAGFSVYGTPAKR